MLPTIVTPSELRKHLAKYLKMAVDHIVVVSDKSSNKVILDESTYNRLTSLCRAQLEAGSGG